MRIPLLKASFVGPKDELKNVIETLKGTGGFEMTFFKRAEGDIAEEERAAYEQLLSLQARIKNAVKFTQSAERELKIKQPFWNKIMPVEYNDLKAYSEYQTDATAIIAKLDELASELNQIKTQIAYNSETVQDLIPYLDLTVPFDHMLPTNSVFILCGIMTRKQFEKFKSDFDLSKISIECTPPRKDKICVILTCHREDASFAEVIYDYGFEKCKFDFDKNAARMMQILADQNVELQSQANAVLRNAVLTADSIRTVKSFYDYVTNEIDTANLTANTLQTQKYYVLNGWVVADGETKIRRALKDYPDIMIKLDRPTDNDEPPVLIKNSAIVKPFRQITNMYGPPSGKDIDPNPFVAFFYFIFFGMMLGDIGYGLILTAAAAAFLYFKKPLGNTKQFILLFALGGISTVLWGIFYGSIFGFSIPSRVIDPIDGAIYLLLLSLGLGAVQLFMGICLNFYKNIRNHKIWDAVLDDVPRIVLFIGLFLFLPKMAFQLFNIPVQSTILDTLTMPGLYTALVGITGIILFNGRKKKGFFGKIIGAFSGAYGLVNYFNDVVSYVRLFALALVGTVLATIGNDMGSMMFGIPVIGYPLGAAVAVAFHAFNLGLGILSAYVHGARLHFIEFFSKFYTGEGTPFKPIGSDLKYTQIKGGK